MGLYDLAIEDDNVIGRKSPDSVKSSAQTWQHVVPVNTQLAIAGTAEDLYSVRTAFAHPTRNIITNPSMETADPPTGYTAVGSILSRQVAPVQFGSNNMRVVTDNAAAQEGFYWQLAVNPPLIRERDGGYSLSVYLRGAAGGETVRLRYWNATDGYIASSAVTTLLIGSFTRLTLSGIKPSAADTTRLYVVTDVQQSSTFYADGMQFEHGGVSAYADGAQGRLFEWEGSAHASTSIRHFPIAEIRGFDLKFDLATYVDFDRTADSTSIAVAAGENFYNVHPIAIRRISILNQTGGERPTLTGVLYGVSITDVGGK